MTPRLAEICRETAETSIRARLCLEGGAIELATPEGFFGHLLEALARHAGWGLELRAAGDVEVDLHHTVEDTGIVLGKALDEALGERRGIVRFGFAYAPLDEALVRAVIDLSGRGRAEIDLGSARERDWVTSRFRVGLLVDFLEALASHARLTLHLDCLRGRSPHHVAEAAIKALALALREACTRRPEQEALVPSTKGTLTA